MSKITKFLSLGIDMCQALPIEEFPDKNAKFVENRIYLQASKMEKALLKVEDYLNKKGVDYTEEPARENGNVKISVSFEGKPAIAEVRFFGIKDNDDFTTDYEPVGRIDMLRFVTDESGVLQVSIPKGDYLVKVSKGSEFEIEYLNLAVSDSFVEESFELKQFVNLYSEGFVAGDIHHHSIYSSPVWGGTDDVIESPKEVANSMQALGLRFGALSDHHNILNHEEWKKCKTKDFHPIPSKEISTSNGHVLALGVDGFDVIYQIPEGEKRTENYLRNEFKRIVKEIKDHEGLPQLNHPRDLQVAISWNKDFYDMTDIFETIEIWNGSNPMYYGTTDCKAAEFWRDLLEKGIYIPATTGSDTHNIRANDYYRLFSKMLWLKERTRKALEEEPNAFREESTILEAFLFICDKFLPMLEVWAKTSLTSGCVRTYAYVEGEPDTKKLLNSLRHGHSFLTNGPILVPRANGKLPGDLIKAMDGKIDLSITLKANRRLKKLTAYLSDKKAIEIPIKELSTASNYDYSLELKDFNIGASKYLFLVAASDITNLAISNPFIVK